MKSQQQQFSLSSSATPNVDEIALYKEQLTRDEKIVLDVSYQILNRSVLLSIIIGGCYQLAFLTSVLLKDSFGIELMPVVGYAEDGDDFLFSHAWIEMRKRKIDLSLHCEAHDLLADKF